MPSGHQCACTVSEKHASMPFLTHTHSLHKHSRPPFSHVDGALQKDCKLFFFYSWFSMLRWITRTQGGKVTSKNSWQRWPEWITSLCFHINFAWPVFAGCCCRVSKRERGSTGGSSHQAPPGGRAGQKQWQRALVRTKLRLCLHLLFRMENPAVIWQMFPNIYV